MNEMRIVDIFSCAVERDRVACMTRDQLRPAILREALDNALEASDILLRPNQKMGWTLNLNLILVETASRRWNDNTGKVANRQWLTSIVQLRVQAQKSFLNVSGEPVHQISLQGNITARERAPSTSIQPRRILECKPYRALLDGWSFSSRQCAGGVLKQGGAEPKRADRVSSPNSLQGKEMRLESSPIYTTLQPLK